MASSFVIAWNSRGLFSKLSALQIYADKAKPFAICVTEPRIDPSKRPPTIPSYFTFSKPHTKTSAGVVIFLRKDLFGPVPHRHRPDLEKSQHSLVLEVRVPGKSVPFLISCVYHHRFANDSHDHWADLKSSMLACLATGLPCLFIGDFNAHDLSWDGRNHDAFGEDLVKFCSTHSLVNLNTVFAPGVPTFPSAGTTIDLALCSDPGFFMDVNVVHNSVLISDHLPIVVSLNTANQSDPLSPQTPRRDYSKADWETFAVCLDGLAGKAMIDCKLAKSRLRSRPEKAINVLNDIVTTCLNTAAAAAVPFKHHRKGAKHWFKVPGVLDALNRLRRARLRARRNHTDAARNEWNAARVNWHRVSKAAQSQSWSTFCEKIFDPATNAINWRRFNAATRQQDATSLAPIAADNQPLATSLDESLNRLGAFYADVSAAPTARVSTDDEILKFVHTRNERETGPSDLDELYSAAELDDVCCKLVHKATGDDGISALLVKHAPRSFKLVLLLVYNFSWRYGVLPVAWKQANVTPLWKGQGNPRNLPKSYRPISLTSVLVKIFERMILARLVRFLDARNFFASGQSGFRKQHNTLDLIYRLIHRVNQAFADRSYVSVAFLDIVAAFDSVWHEGLLYKLHKAGVRGLAYRWISSFLTGRQLRVASQGKFSDWFNLGAGVPQGSILGPFLFLVFINDIPACSGVVVALFADDIAVWSTSNGTAGDRYLDDALWEIAKWARKWHLEFSLKKSATVCFSRKRTPPTPKPIRLGLRTLPRVDRYRYLGAILTRNLTWGVQSDKAALSAQHAACCISRIITPLGPPPHVIRTLVQALVLPILSYGWPLWTPPTERHWGKLESVVCFPLRCSLGLPVSTEKLALFVEFALVRPQLWHGCSAIVFAHRIDTQLAEANPKHPAHLIFREQSRAALPRNCPKYRIPLAKAVKTVEWQLGVDHDSSEASRISSLRKPALSRQIRQILGPKEPHKRSRYATAHTMRLAPASYLLLDPRKTAILRARLRFNRHHLRARQYKLRLANSPWCPACDWIPRPGKRKPQHLLRYETPEHVLLSCPRFQLLRINLSAELALQNISPNLDIITGDFTGVRPEGVADIRAATADFLHRIERVVCI